MTIELVGPEGYVHGWKFVGVPGVTAHADLLRMRQDAKVLPKGHPERAKAERAVRESRKLIRSAAESGQRLRPVAVPPPEHLSIEQKHQHAISSGVNDSITPASGSQASTTIAKYNDGSKWVEKEFNVEGGEASAYEKDSVLNEELVSRISDILGAGAPHVVSTSDSSVAMPYVDNSKPGSELLAEFQNDPNTPNIKPYPSTFDVPALKNAVYSSEGKLIGLLDIVIGNGDRNAGNYLITDDGKPVPIDHNSSFFNNPFGVDGPFAQTVMPSDFTSAQYTKWQSKLDNLYRDTPYYEIEVRSKIKTAISNLDKFKNSGAERDSVKVEAMIRKARDDKLRRIHTGASVNPPAHVPRSGELPFTGADTVMQALELVGPKGYSHGWVFHGVPGVTPHNEILKQVKYARKNLPVKHVERKKAERALSESRDINGPKVEQLFLNALSVIPNLISKTTKRKPIKKSKTVVNFTTVVNLVGPEGYVHGWKFVGVPGVTAHKDLLKMRAESKLLPKGHPERLKASRAVIESRKIGSAGLPTAAPKRQLSIEQRYQQAVSSGLEDMPVTPSRGAQAMTHIVTYNDGSKWVTKNFGGSDYGHDYIRNEVLASQISRIIGAGAPHVIEVRNTSEGDAKGDPEAIMPFVSKAKSAAEVLHESYSLGPGHDTISKAISSPQGKLIGLLDHLIENRDRNAGNWLITTEGNPVPIDHNSSFPNYGRGGSGPFDDVVKSSDFTREQYYSWNRELQKLLQDTPADQPEVRSKIERAIGNLNTFKENFSLSKKEQRDEVESQLADKGKALGDRYKFRQSARIPLPDRSMGSALRSEAARQRRAAKVRGEMINAQLAKRAGQLKVPPPPKQPLVFDTERRRWRRAV